MVTQLVGGADSVLILPNTEIQELTQSSASQSHSVNLCK